MLQFIKFQKSYGSFLALKIDDCVIEPGIYWIRGVNGSGKSTLLKVIAGILSFDGDLVLNNATSIKKQAVAYRKLVNFAEAEPLFPEFLTGREMVRVFTETKKGPINQEHYFIESMKMQGYIDMPLGTYSSGMIKKLSLVLAFMGNADLVLLDEPLITLDSESLKILYKWISERHRQEGTSFLIASHQALEQDALFTAKELLVEMKTLKFKD